MGHKKKLLFFSDCFVYSGSEHLLSNLLTSAAVKEAYDVCLAYRWSARYEQGVEQYIPGDVARYPLGLLSNGSVLYELGLRKRTLFRRAVMRALELIEGSGAYALINYLLLVAFFRKVRPDILHINNGGYPAAMTARIAVLAARRAGIGRIVFTVNNMAAEPSGLLDRKLDQVIGAAVDRFVTASEAAMRRLVEVRGFAREKALCIPNTIGYDGKFKNLGGRLRQEWGLAPDTPVIGAVGLLTRRKGFHVLVEAIASIRGAVEALGAKVFIFGDGEERAALADLVAARGLSDIVVLAGHRANVLEYVCDFDLFVLPSIANEDFPYVNLEAMLLGKPIVSTRVAGIPEQVEEGKTGFIVEPEDAAALGARVLRLLEDPVLRAAMGQNSFERYNDNFTYEKVVARYLELYEDADRHLDMRIAYGEAERNEQRAS